MPGSKLTCHQPATGVVDGPSSSCSDEPHGMAVRMLAPVPTPSRRLRAVAVTRAVPPGASVAVPRPPLPPPPTTTGAAPPGSPSLPLSSPPREAVPPQPMMTHAVKAVSARNMRGMIAWARESVCAACCLA
jgi:hypothetical protein